MFTAARRTIAKHWPEYAMEAAGLGLFMISACTFASLLEHPASPLREAIEDPVLRRGFMGIAMGVTAFLLISSPWGQRSGAHLNPAVTLTFWSLGKIAPWDALCYVVAQFAGGVLGIAISEVLIGMPLRHAAVNHVVTIPGPAGWVEAFLAELAISALLMAAVLTSSNGRATARWTPAIAGILVASYILLEAPLSGMSMNPARTLSSAVAANQWTALWIYFTAPAGGMLAAAFLYRTLAGTGSVLCAKLHHHNQRRCIFRCNYGSIQEK